MESTAAALQLTTTADRVIISLDKSSIKIDSLLRLLEILRLEILAEKINFDESIEDLGEEMVANWWSENKERYLIGAQA